MDIFLSCLQLLLLLGPDEPFLSVSTFRPHRPPCAVFLPPPCRVELHHFSSPSLERNVFAPLYILSSLYLARLSVMLQPSVSAPLYPHFFMHDAAYHELHALPTPTAYCQSNGSMRIGAKETKKRKLNIVKQLE